MTLSWLKSLGPSRIGFFLEVPEAANMREC